MVWALFSPKEGRDRLGVEGVLLICQFNSAYGYISPQTFFDNHKCSLLFCVTRIEDKMFLKDLENSTFGLVVFKAIFKS